MQIDPDFKGAYLSLANVQRGQNKYVEAIQTLRDGQLARDQNPNLLRELSLTTLEAVSLDQIDAQQSLTLSRKWLNVNASDPESMLMVTVALLQNGFDQQAIDKVASIEEDRFIPELLLIEAIANSNLDRRELAVQRYLAAKKTTRPIFGTAVPVTTDSLAEIEFRI